MSIFTRREIQKRLDSLILIVGKKKLRQIVEILNIEGSELNEKRLLESLTVAWEVVIVSAFAEIGDVKYERKISNGKRPDILFCDQGISLLADVVGVSDDQQHKKNPVNDFSTIIQRLWVDLGPSKGGLAWRVEAVDLNPSGTSQTTSFCWPLHLSSKLRPINHDSLKRLALPPLSELREYLHKKLIPFFEELRISPNNSKTLHVNDQYNSEITVCFTVTYFPNGTGLMGSHPSYTTVTDIESHVLWRRLTGKSKQFALATEDLPRILFVCDAGCAALTDSFGGGSEYRLEEVLGHFWRRPKFSEDQHWLWITEENVSAVIALSIVPLDATWLYPGQREFILKVHPYPNPYSRFPLDETSAKVLCQVFSKLPAPIESPANALRSVSANPISTRRIGGFSMKANRIEMSGVELLRILSGELSLEEFCHNYSLQSNPFKDALLRFQTIRSMKVEPATDRDDDKIIVEFGPHDAAIGPFRVSEGDKS